MIKEALAQHIIPNGTTVTVDLGARSYPIYIGTGLISKTAELIEPVLKQRRVHIISDKNVASHYLKPLLKSLDTAAIVHSVTIIPPGEDSKNITTLTTILNELLDARVERNTTIIALGGGVVGDIAGFAASILLRGIDFIQIPTSLLAQVDSSVGGKTGIDTQQGKNLIGSFHQPLMVITDTDTLNTLPIRELRAGYAEVAKYGLIDRPEFWAWLQENGDAVIGSPNIHKETSTAARTHAIAESCRAKADIVSRDETENSVRALLNLGHTFGHAFETLCGYGTKLVHGEAVSIGIIIAFQVSERIGNCKKGTSETIARHLSSLGLPISPSEIDHTFTVTELWQTMLGDKKVSDGNITLVVARGIGQSFLSRNVEPSAIQATLKQSLEKL